MEKSNASCVINRVYTFTNPYTKYRVCEVYKLKQHGGQTTKENIKWEKH